MLTACEQQNVDNDTVMCLMVDQTDPLTVKPEASTLLAPFRLKENPWQGITIKIVNVAATDVHRTETVSLPSENEYTGNLTVRTANIARFKDKLQRCLASFDCIHSCPRSIIFRSVQQEATLLARSTAPRRLLVLYSDLRENSNVNFYNPETLELVRRNPALVAKKLTENKGMPDLSGIHVYLLYSPASYKQNEVYMPIAHMYEQTYTARHAHVYIQSQFSMQ